MTRWPRWQLDGEERTLARYVRPDVVAELLVQPGRSGESPITRLQTVYEALAQRGIGYAYEAASDDRGRQVIRPPDQVLWAPRHGTCLDLALVLAAAGITAGLDATIVFVEPPGGVGALHVVVLFRVEQDAPRLGDDVLRAAPDGLAHLVQASLDGPDRPYVAVDPVGFAVSLGTTATRGLGVGFGAAVASGARYLLGTGPAWTWRLGVDIAATWHKDDVQPLQARPTNPPLRDPYRSATTAATPLRTLRAEYQLVQFQNRDELTVLRDWCRGTAAGTITGLAVITGLGGSGKTRLVLELAHRMRAEGWYAGTLPKGSAGVDWLADVVSPILVVVDYADGRVGDTTALVKALHARQGPPAVVVLTARSTDGDWLPDIENALQDDRQLFRIEHVALPDAHPDAGDVYLRTIRALTAGPVSPPELPRGIRWTPWTSSCSAGSPPTAPPTCPRPAPSSTTRCWSTRSTTGVPSVRR